jgi:ferredoxin
VLPVSRPNNPRPLSYQKRPRAGVFDLPLLPRAARRGAEGPRRMKFAGSAAGSPGSMCELFCFGNNFSDCKIRHFMLQYSHNNIRRYQMAYKINDDCTACGACADECAVEAISEKDGKYFIDPEKCIDCGLCAGVCPVEAPQSE